MITVRYSIRRSIAARVIAFLLVVGVAVLPALPQPRMHVCPMMGTMQDMSLGSCCCSTHHNEQSPAQQIQSDWHDLHDGGICCHQVAYDLHQPSGAIEIAPIAMRVEMVNNVVDVLGLPAHHEERHDVSDCRAAYPDGPPSYVLWGAFLM
jgi:hypothetical protein